MAAELFQAHALLLVGSEALPDEVLQVLRQIFKQVNAVLVDLLNELSLVAAGPRCFAMQDLVQNNAHRPDIVFCGVDIALQCLRTHVKRRADVDCFLGVGGGLLGEAEISDFDHLVPEEDIGGFEIAVQEAVLRDVDIPHDKLPDDGQGVLLC